jgi:hypothetical protein
MKNLFFVLAICFNIYTSSSQEISLNGKWNTRLDSSDGRQHIVDLPGTLDDAGIGYASTAKPVSNIATFAHLARKVQYTGKAYYSRMFSVPASWQSKRIKVVLGRVLWKSAISIDGKQVPGNGESLVSAHEFDITDYVVPGTKQTITICIDNSNIYPGINVYSKKYPSSGSAEMTHAYTNHTQIKWNGILGYVKLVARPSISIRDVQVSSDLQTKQLHIAALVENKENKSVKLTSFVTDAGSGKRWDNSLYATNATTDSFRYTIPFKNDVTAWNEFAPTLYTLVTVVQTEYGTDTVKTKFGIRDLKVKGGDLYLNDNRLFLRGNLECIIFPKTGYPPMQKGEWLRLFSTARSYGLNMLRFHSWCPPDVAFQAADESGVYLQVELPHWNMNVGKDTAAFSFLHREAEAILKMYGNHPSFCFFSMGNELEGDFAKLNQLVAELKNKDQRHLYSTTTFTFQKGITGAPQPEDDFYVTQWTNKGWVRGQIVFNDESPSFSKDYNASLEGVNVPLISHEIGQYSVYPDLTEIEKYDGNLLPLNFIAVRNDLRKKGLLQLSSSFLRASGKFASLLYKEEIERALKTKGFDGFQLLQLQDFPGQGTALVGLLNAFWQSKGVVTAKEFHQYNSELTPLIRFPKAVYTNDEIFTANVELANFYKPLYGTELVWSIRDENKIVLETGSFGKKDYSVGSCLPVGELTFVLKKITKAKKLVIEISVKGTQYHNEWCIWVYPSMLKEENRNVLVTGSISDALDALEKGGKVLLCPSPDTLKGIAGKFVPVFWSPVHFANQPGTMGLLIKSVHKALKEFPTDFYSNWQWWDLTIKSKTLDVTTLPDKAIIVRVIDNFTRNHNLSNLFEAKVGTGRLIFCSIDILTDLDKRPQAKQLRYSLLKYMNGQDFNPGESFTKDQLKQYFK